MSKDLVIKKKRLNVTTKSNNTKMINSNYITKKYIKEHNLNWSQVPDNLYNILIVRVLDLKKQMYCLI